MVGGDADGQPLDLTESPFTLAIADGVASGETPCNSYSFPLEIDGSTMSFGAGEQTAVGCLGVQGDLERLYLTSLGPNTHFSVDGSTLTLQASGAEWVFESRL